MIMMHGSLLYFVPTLIVWDRTWYPGNSNGLPHVLPNGLSNGHTPSVQIAGVPPMSNGYPVLPMAVSNPCGHPIGTGNPSPLSNSTISTPSPSHFSPGYVNGNAGYNNTNGRRYPNMNATQSPGYPTHGQFQVAYSHHASPWQQPRPPTHQQRTQQPPQRETVAANQGTVHQTAEASGPQMDPRAASHHTMHQALPESMPPAIRQQSAPDQRLRVHFADQSNVEGPEGQTPAMFHSQSHRVPLAPTHPMKYRPYAVPTESALSASSVSSNDLANQAVDDAVSTVPSLQKMAYAQTAHVIRARDDADDIAGAPSPAVPKLQFASQSAWASDLLEKLEKIEAPALLAFDVDENDDDDNEDDIFPAAPGRARPALQMAITAPVAGAIINGMKAASRGQDASKLKQGPVTRGQDASKPNMDGFTMLCDDEDDPYGDDELLDDDAEDEDEA